MPAENKVRENRLRRTATRRGFRLEKSRGRDPRAPNYGGFMLANMWNMAVVGAHPSGYSANLDEIEEFLDNIPLTSSN